ncbi:hypothetical protein CALVIDRAFT_601814 [Calocera viscosa TUFC12733]|uniref:BZIP domain-containing protein n=1 Tax=Calocera viscosa (strain TUFC12733) TaxID=1330018 RepID=A0A167HU08_CALVF|nr:hypothetical protein CALVIDRAFT_601814 [Calocera viscosa TUFC12733]
MLSPRHDAGRHSPNTIPISKTLRSSISNATRRSTPSPTLSPLPDLTFNHCHPAPPNSSTLQFTSTLPANDSPHNTPGLTTLSNTWDFLAWDANATSSACVDSSQPSAGSSNDFMSPLFELPTWTVHVPSPSSADSSTASFLDAFHDVSPVASSNAGSGNWPLNEASTPISDHEDMDQPTGDTDMHFPCSPTTFPVSHQMMDHADTAGQDFMTRVSLPNGHEQRTKLSESERLRRQRARNREGARRWREKQRGELERYKEESLQLHCKLKREELANRLLREQVDNNMQHIKWLTHKLCDVNTSLKRMQSAPQTRSPSGPLLQSPDSILAMLTANMTTLPPLSLLHAFSGFGKQSTAAAQ